MSRFGPNPEQFFGEVYAEAPPWDIGGPQPALMELLHAIPPRGPFLDLGCGSGDLAIALAHEGHEVVGIDFVPQAIEQARFKAAQLPADVHGRLEFHVADGLRPSALGRRFGAIVDSGFFHLFDPHVADELLPELARTLEDGGRYYLLAFAVTFPIPHSPRAITPAELHERFTPERGWRTRMIRSAEFLSRIAPVPATCACMEYMARRDES